jgi:hypothetical protein
MRAAGLRALLAGGISTLLSFYNASSGYFGLDAPPSYWPFWHTGNSLETLALAHLLTGDARVPAVLANSFSKVRRDYVTPYAGNDDIQWHAHAWLRAYEATGEPAYLREVETIYGPDMLLGETWRVWNFTCAGANWAENAPYVNTITTSLFASGMSSLARTTRSDAPIVFNRSAAQWAAAAWAWGTQPGLQVSAGGPFLDGVDTHNCSLPVGEVWTYNSAHWLDAGTSLSALFGSPAYAARSAALLRGAAAYFGGAGGVMEERNCGGAGGWCPQSDGRMFKGVFARHAAWALRDWRAEAPGAAAAAWACTNAASLDANGTQWRGAALPLWGQLWQGPYAADDTPWVAHSAGLDVMLAALAGEVWAGAACEHFA